jgi:hypothetical protein
MNNSVLNVKDKRDVVLAGRKLKYVNDWFYYKEYRNIVIIGK